MLHQHHSSIVIRLSARRCVHATVITPSVRAFIVTPPLGFKRSCSIVVTPASSFDSRHVVDVALSSSHRLRDPVFITLLPSYTHRHPMVLIPYIPCHTVVMPLQLIHRHQCNFFICLVMPSSSCHCHSTDVNPSLPLYSNQAVINQSSLCCRCHAIKVIASPSDSQYHTLLCHTVIIMPARLFHRHRSSFVICLSSHQSHYATIVTHLLSSHCPHVVITLSSLYHRHLIFAMPSSYRLCHSIDIIPLHHSIVVTASAPYSRRYPTMLTGDLGKQVPQESGTILEYVAYS